MNQKITACISVPKSIKIHFENKFWHKKADHLVEGNQSENLHVGKLIK